MDPYYFLVVGYTVLGAIYIRNTVKKLQKDAKESKKTLMK
jgi:hypothetical protein